MTLDFSISTIYGMRTFEVQTCSTNLMNKMCFAVYLYVFISTAIPMLPLDMLTPQIRHYELWQKNSRYDNFRNLSTPSYAIFDFVKKFQIC